MRGLGTIINVGAILLGGVLSAVLRKKISGSMQDTLMKVCGVSSAFIGVAGVMQQMLTVEEGKIVSGQALMLTVGLATGALIGELLHLDDLLERFGDWLKKKSGNSGDARFTEGFVTASLTVCVGAMAIIGSIEDGIRGNWSILATKAVLDCIIVMILTVPMGKGCVFSAIPVAIIQGAMTLLAVAIEPLFTDATLNAISLVGSAMITCVGINLIFGKTVKVANLLPALVTAVLFRALGWM